MANRRVLVKRRKTARNIRKITRTMQLIATARFQAAFKRAVASKPYTDKMDLLVRNLMRATSGDAHPLMREPEEVGRGALLVLTSTRGLCGGYNSNLLRATVEHLDRRREEGSDSDVYMVGKKGIAYFRFTDRALAEEVTDLDDRPRYEQVEPLANRLMERFVDGEVGALDVAYMKFVSAGRQLPVVERILPLAGLADETEEPPGLSEVEYEFSPEPMGLLGELLPATVRMRLFQCFTDAVVSEQVARMVAMKAATDAAGDMIKRLTQQYNRARQTAITMELLDIVGGADALA